MYQGKTLLIERHLRLSRGRRLHSPRILFVLRAGLRGHLCHLEQHDSCTIRIRDQLIFRRQDSRTSS